MPIKEMLDIYNRSVKVELPEYANSTLSGHSRPSDIGCLVYPLFTAVPGVFPSYHVNSALWSAYAFESHSNINELEIPIYFYVSSDIVKEVKQIFQRADVDDRMLITWEPRQRSEEMGKARWLSQKLYIILDDRFNNFETVIFIDTDVFLARRKGSDAVLDIESLFSVPITQRHLFAAFRIGRRRQGRMRCLYDKTSGKADEEEIQAFLSLINRYTTIQTDRLYSVKGYINGFCPRYLEESYKEHIAELLPLLWCDESINALYLYNGNGLRDINDNIEGLNIIERAFLLHELTETGCPHFLTHIDAHHIQDPEDRQLWRELVNAM